MREIKFRVWYEGLMFYNARVGGFDETRPTVFSSDGEWVNLEPIEGDAIMQYTGLNDKNGKEIYEGDIVSFTNPDTGTTAVSKVFFDCGGFSISIYADYCPFMGELFDYGIIGNIYENPELLE